MRNAELIEDVGAGVLVGGGGQREPGHAGEAIEQRAQQAIVGAEVMAPFADAMRFVDREQRDPAALQQLAEVGSRGAFGGDVEQVELAIEKATARFRLVLVDAGERGGADADRLGGAELIVHEGDQRGDDDRGAVEHRGGELIGQRLAGAGGHDGERGLAGEDTVDDAALHAAEIGIAP